jgi:hypothetical protein
MDEFLTVAEVAELLRLNQLSVRETRPREKAVRALARDAFTSGRAILADSSTPAGPRIPGHPTNSRAWRSV